MLKQYLTVFAGAITWACFVATLAAAEKPVEGPIGVFLGKPRMEVQPLFEKERHPNIVVTLKGTVRRTVRRPTLLQFPIALEREEAADAATLCLERRRRRDLDRLADRRNLARRTSG